MKTCPQCGQQWGVKFRFCPQDGAELPELVATVQPAAPSDPPKVVIAKPRTNQRLVNVVPVTSLPTDPAQPAVKDKPFAMPEPQRTRRTGREGGQADARSRAFGSLTEAPRSDEEPAWLVEHRATSKADSLMRVAPTVQVDALTPEQVAADRKARAAEARKGKKSGPMRGDAAAAEAPTAPDQARPELPQPKGKRARGEFSETAWFANTPNIDEANLATGEVAVDPDKYTRTEALPPERRKRFTLRREGEE